MVGLLNPT